MRDVDRVWSRACRNEGTGPGDRHLSTLLQVHGVLLNSGAAVTAGRFPPAELLTAAASAEYFGLHSLARLLREIPAAAISRHDEQRLDDEYHDLDPDGLMIPAAFEEHYAESHDDFDPVTTSPR
ncbi:hypothetical protein GCM10010168_29040 [Actinoplanes ianthinogenes]|uniref:Uncharacterized protein n=1 Tax=Actinoplanes ianthinogenes TaxID=122358 RepID=A0ABM7LLA2_9ACTN|nr:hypothetical protein [Actinoplanes ianthinogenes]BCJ40046.1 hypothetical protein Aiant_07030 [Actinoplanes ianthinogenes]GGR09906.1 hypothetical protein GCM10010168_29040 [Actinoplanes ianthinogenes]